VSGVSGFAAPGFEPVRETFARNFAERGELGSSFAAYVDGELVVDLWGGVADAAAGRAWEADTLCGIYSGTKGLVSTCMLMLIERGALALDEPVCAYWPEFAAEGKDAILVRHVLTHTAGLPGVLTPVTFEQMLDDALMARLLAAQKPISAPGEIIAYHALTYGWLCGELVRRVDGRSVGRFLHEEVARPLGLDAWIGLPAEHEPRVAVLERTSAFGTEYPPLPDGAAASDERMRILWSVIGNPPRVVTDVLTANERSWRAAEIPGANGVATARGMARLYACLARGGELDGVRLLSPATVADAGRLHREGHDPYRDTSIIYGLGFHLREDDGALGPERDAFGHGGAGGSIHGCWPRLRTGFSYTTNMLDGAENPRTVALTAALHEAVEGAA
jgi:CubicO group peptidase (beta-lactamase class C family)